MKDLVPMESKDWVDLTGLGQVAVCAPVNEEMNLQVQ